MNKDISLRTTLPYFVPTPSEQYEGFYEIPHFSRYVINKEGVVIRKLTGDIKKYFEKYDKYLCYNVIDDDNKQCFVGRFRLLCITFKYHVNWRNLQVNHIDNNRQNDSLDNLEWVTPRQNWQHGWEHGEINKHHSKSLLIKSAVTNKVYSFNQLQEAANFLNIAPSTLTRYIHTPNQPVIPGLYQLKFGADPTPWRKVEDPWLDFMVFTDYKVIQVYNTKTNEMKIFPSAAECARGCNLKVTTLSERLKSGNGETVYSDDCIYAYYPLLNDKRR